VGRQWQAIQVMLDGQQAHLHRDRADVAWNG
jgi:hypothetical protein